MRSRTCAGARTRARGYSEVKTPLIYDKARVGDERLTGRSSARTCSSSRARARSRTRAEADELPGAHAPLRLVASAPTATCRSATRRARPLHRNELAGALHGLLRVRHVTQDDAHIFCTDEQVAAEIDACIEYVKDLYAIFGVTPHAELSTRPEERLGTDEEWDHAEGILRDALERHGIEYVIGEGEGTFYAPPRSTCTWRDTLGRSWQMGTIQADAQMPRRFGLTYMGPDNVEHTPVVIHRALLGSLERFIGIVVEHYGGAFPFWLAPVQVRLIPVGENHRDAVHELRQRFEAEGFRADVDERDETLGKRIREAELEKIPFTIVYGDRESDDAARGPRARRRPADHEPLGAARTVPGRDCYDQLLKEGADHCPSPSRAPSSRGFNRAGWTRNGGRCLQRFLSSMRRIQRAW